MSAPKICVLLVEDNPSDVVLVREAMEESSVRAEVLVVNDGQKAMEFVDAADSSGGPQPDFVILDLNLPKRSGHEVLRHLRASRTLKDVPVLVLSSSDAPRDRDAAQSLGVSHYVRKPSRLEDLAAMSFIVGAFLTGGSSSGAV